MLENVTGSLLLMDHCDLATLFMSENWTELDVRLTQFSVKYQYYHGYLCVAVCVFGIINNILNTLVLTQPSMRTSINIILAAISVCDTGTMTTYLIYVIHFYVLKHKRRCYAEMYTKGWLYFILFHSLWSILLHTTSLWLAVLLAFIRLVVIRKHHMTHSFLDTKNVAKLIFIVFIPLTILCGPISLITVVVEEPGYAACEENSTRIGYNTRPSSMALNNNCLLLRITLWINGILFKLLPCVLLAVLICVLLWTFSKAKKRNTRIMHRRNNPSVAGMDGTSIVTAATAARNINSRPSTFGQILAIPNLLVTQHGEEGRQINQVYKSAYTSRTTTMLTAILLIFLLTEIPQAIIATLSGLSPSDIYFRVYYRLGDVLDILALINSSVNFILYCTMSSRFRSTFIRLFVPERILRIRSWSASSNSELNQLPPGDANQLRGERTDREEKERQIKLRRKRSDYYSRRTSSLQNFEAQTNGVEGVERKIQKIDENSHLLSIPNLRGLSAPPNALDKDLENIT